MNCNMQKRSFGNLIRSRSSRIVFSSNVIIEFTLQSHQGIMFSLTRTARTCKGKQARTRKRALLVAPAAVHHPLRPGGAVRARGGQGRRWCEGNGRALRIAAIFEPFTDLNRHLPFLFSAHFLPRYEPLSNAKRNRYRFQL